MSTEELLTNLDSIWRKDCLYFRARSRRTRGARGARGQGPGGRGGGGGGRLSYNEFLTARWRRGEEGGNKTVPRVVWTKGNSAKLKTHWTQRVPVPVVLRVKEYR